LGNLLLLSEGFLASVFVRLPAPIATKFRHFDGVKCAATPAALVLNNLALSVEFAAWLHHDQSLRS
jgi:hypothetical protein